MPTDSSVADQMESLFASQVGSCVLRRADISIVFMMEQIVALVGEDVVSCCMLGWCGGNEWVDRKREGKGGKRGRT